MSSKLLAAFGIGLFLSLTSGPADAEDAARLQAMSLLGDPKYGAGTEHFDYVDPDAPKGGRLVYATVGTFDNLNPIVVRGRTPSDLDLVFDPLMKASMDEIGVVYGLIAEGVEISPDMGSAVFHIDPDARWHDGAPITADDVAWTFERIREIGKPILQASLADVDGVEVVDDKAVRFTFKTLGDMKPILEVAGLRPQPRHWWEDRNITRTTTEPPLGSGPYRVSEAEIGKLVVYERVADYWADDHWVNVGQHNFDEMRYDFYRDSDVAFEALIAGDSDFRFESGARRWATGYQVAAVDRGDLVLAEVPRDRPGGAQGFFMNTRRPVFADAKTREALALAFDFDWVNDKLLYSSYTRIGSYFRNSAFASSGKPEGLELEYLEPFRGTLDPRLFEEEWKPSAADERGSMRSNLAAASRLLTEAGWVLQNGRRSRNGIPLEFEILIRFQSFERLTLPFVENLEKIGAIANVRFVDAAQWKQRMDTFDFDMVSTGLSFSPPPGTDLRSFFQGAAAGEQGSANFAGIDDPVVDNLVEAVVNAPDEDHLVAASRALDRVLLWNFYMVPQWYAATTRMAYWNRFGRPDPLPRYTVGFPEIWWFDEERAAALDR